MKNFADLRRGQLIHVTTTNGIVQIRVEKIIRGTGSQASWLTIEGTCRQAVMEGDRCGVTFNGVEHPGIVFGVVQQRGYQILSFQAFISDPEFWREFRQ
jgi:hypothetical protein